MLSDQPRRKRKRFLKSSSFSFISSPSCVRLFVFLLFFSFFLFNGGFPFASDLFRPVLVVFQSPPLFSTVNPKVNESNSYSDLLIVEDRVVFPDHILLLITHKKDNPSLLKDKLDCIYRPEYSNSSDLIEDQILLPVISVDDYDELRWIARCPLAPGNYSNGVILQKEDSNVVMVDEHVHSWETVTYAAALDGKTAVVFVKGLNLRPGRVSDPTQISCHFNSGVWNKSRRYGLTTNAITAAQEVVRCPLPISLQKHPELASGVRVSITSQPVRRGRGRGRGRVAMVRRPIPSAAKLQYSGIDDKDENKYELCACTMLWNQASALREWIMYHSWLGVEKWFIYDNNSDDGIKEVVEELERGNYNVSRQVWPWVKTQEAGFSHCALKAKKECKWMAFMDVDEFFYFPFPTPHQHRKISELDYPGRLSLQSLVQNFSSTSIGEIRTVCHSFGPSGLSSRPAQGATVGYTCRLQSPERHKSIVRLEALDNTLLNVVHHFRLKTQYRYLNLPQSTATVNHYKYQVWEVFRAKFFRRVATYVTDWQENQNEGSKDRAPGLGTEAIEPPNWRLQFCEVWDTGLRDFVIANLADPVSGLLPWKKPLL